MSTAATEEVFLTKEEQEALADESVDAAEKAQAAEAAKAAEGGADEDAKTKAAVAEVKSEEAAATTTPAPEVTPNAEAATTQAPVATAAEQGQGAPLLVAQAPEDADAKLAAISTQKGELTQKFDDGDITAKEYQSGLDKLNKSERDIEFQINNAKLAGDMETQRLKNEWTRDCDAFLAKNPEYVGEANKERNQHLDETVRAIAVMPRNAGLTGAQILEKAHMIVKAERGEAVTTTAPPAAKAVAAKPELPPTLAHVPAAAGTEAGEGKWAALDRLQTTDPLQYEAKLEAMSESDRNAYLASA